MPLLLPYTFVFQSGVLFLGYSFGLPVVASEVGSLTDDVTEGVTGFACPPSDPAALAEVLNVYFRSPLFKELDNRREGIRKFARERYSWDTVASISTRVYSELSQKKSGPGMVA